MTILGTLSLVGGLMLPATYYMIFTMRKPQSRKYKQFAATWAMISFVCCMLGLLRYYT